jgi:Ricin-type beta-trefoil lectin domain-like
LDVPVLRSRAFLLASLALCILRAQGGFTGPGRYQIASVKSGKVIGLDPNDPSIVIESSTRNTRDQLWEIRLADAGYWLIRNAMTGAALEIAGMGDNPPVRATLFTGDRRQQWRIQAATDGHALITSRLGKALELSNATSRDGTRVRAADANGDLTQRFVFRRMGGLSRAKPINGQ